MFIYKITNKLNGKIYIGQTIRSIKTRISEHMSSNTLVGNEMNNLGISNFDISMVEKCTSKKQLNESEAYWINFYDSIYPNGYNKAIVDSKYGKFNPFYNRHHTKEAIKNNQSHQPNVQRILCIETGIVYNSLRECANETNISRTHIKRLCLCPNTKTKFNHFALIR